MWKTPEKSLFLYELILRVCYWLTCLFRRKIIRRVLIYRPLIGCRRVTPGSMGTRSKAQKRSQLVPGSSSSAAAASAAATATQQRHNKVPIMEVGEEKTKKEKNKRVLMSIETFFFLTSRSCKTAETSSPARFLPPWQPIQRRSASWIYGEVFKKRV